MNICLNQESIRIRLNDAEFNELKTSGKLSHNFTYWPLLVNIITAQPHARISKLSATQLEIYLEDTEVGLLAVPEIQKSGLTILAETTDGQEMIIIIQLDLHKNK